MAKLKTVVETELKGHCCKKRVLKPGVEVRGRVPVGTTVESKAAVKVM